MARNWLSDEDVEKEIKKLQKSDLVKLARKKKNNEYRRRQYLYGLRILEKEGKKLKEAGITMEMLEQEKYFEED